MSAFKIESIKLNSIFANENNISSIDALNPSAEGIFIKPSKLLNRVDITNYVLTSINNYGKIGWEAITLDKLQDVHLLGAVDGDILKYNEQEKLWMPYPEIVLTGGDCISVYNNSLINLLFDDKKLSIVPGNKLSLKHDYIKILSNNGIDISNETVVLGDTVNISVDSTVLRTTGDQIKTGDLEITGLLNAEIVSDGFITINSGDIANVTTLSFMENNGGNDQITITAPNSIDSGGYTLKLPSNQGPSNHFLVNDGMGNLSWKSVAASVTPGGITGSIQFKDSLNTFSGSNNFIYDGTNTNLIGGQMFASAFNANSDINLKKEIEPIPNCLELIDKIETYQYKWKITSEKSFGVIAQQLEEIGLESIVKDNNGIKSVNYNELLSILIGAVKELSKKLK